MTNTNIAATRYLTSTRVDLSSVFMPLSFGGQYPETGYKLSSGADLNTIFCQKYLSAAANKTSLLLSDGQDLSDVFEKRHTVGYSTIAYSETAGTSPAIRALYPLTSSIIYFGGDQGTFRSWSGSGTSSTNIGGIATSNNDTVRAIYARNQTNVYVGGTFVSVNNNVSMSNFARYTGSGSTFNPVGSTAINGTVSTIFGLDPSNVYVGGNFLNGGTIGIRVTRLNTYSEIFTPLTSITSDVSLNNGVNSISALDISNVYIGGAFTNGGNVGKYITRWDGEIFNKLGNDEFNSNVNSIHALDPTHIYMVGPFTQYGGNTNMNRVAMWDGTNMNALGSGISSSFTDVRTIYALDENHVYIGGSSDHIKMWNGRDYITLAGTGSLSLQIVMASNMVPNDKTLLYIGGGGNANGGIQKWTT